MMGSIRGTQIRRFVSLVSVVFFVVLLRTHTEWGHLFGASASSQTWVSGLSSSLQLVDAEGQVGYQDTGRHVLGLENSAGFNGRANHTGFIKKKKVITRPCTDVDDHVGFPDSCSYVRANTECHSGTLVEYITAYYCTFAMAPILANVLIFLWLMMLFYMLGNTAADYFCCSLEKLSNLLRLPPTVAGVSLLPLGNGAPDVFASIAAFMGTGHSQVGLNSVLGGALFVTSVVAGSISLLVQPSTPELGRPRLDCNCFFRDVGFFVISLGALCTIIYRGKIHFWGAVGYLSIYLVYGITVAAFEVCKKGSGKKHHSREDRSNSNPAEEGSSPGSDTTDDDVLCPLEDTNIPWDWQRNRHVAIYSHNSLVAFESTLAELENGHHYNGDYTLTPDASLEEPACGKICCEILDFPLGLPRRLTIPVVEETRWSRPYAIASATLAPTLLAGVWDSKDGEPYGSSMDVYIFGFTVGITLGILAFFSTEKDRPPTRWSLPWVVGGFIMSIVWFYLIANELVGVLVALGVILEIDSAILGLTVLAWGNSIGDLISNLALAKNGGDSVQIAISGCYAGPMFNVLVGLGLSFVLASWKTFPKALILPEDDTLFYTLGFLFVSLVWALVVLPARGMAPSKALGVGLLFLYASFLSLRLANSLGFFSLDGFQLGSLPGYFGTQVL